MANNRSVRKNISKKRKRMPAKTTKRSRLHARRQNLKAFRKDAGRGPIKRAQRSGIELETEDMPLGMRAMANRERTDSERVEELAEEGQPFEAALLAGVEQAEDSDEAEVPTHEVLADDVPSEYDAER